MERKSVDVFSYLSDIYTAIIVYSSLLDFLILKKEIHNVPIQIFSSLFGYILLICLLYLLHKKYGNEHCFVLKTEIMIVLVILSLGLSTFFQMTSFPVILFYIALLLNLISVTRICVFKNNKLGIMLIAGISSIYVIAAVVSGIWVGLVNKLKVAFYFIGNKIIDFVNDILFRIEQFILFVYSHIDNQGNGYMRYGMKMGGGYEKEDLNVTIGVAIVIIIIVLIFTLLVVLLKELFKKSSILSEMKSRSKSARLMNKSNRKKTHSFVIWLKEKKEERKGFKKVLHRIIKICKHTECQMKESDTPLKFMDKVISQYSKEGTVLYKKLSQIAEEINRCYYSKDYCHKEISPKEINYVLYQLRCSVRKKKKENLRKQLS